MTPEPQSESYSAVANELVAMTAELLSEAGDLGRPSICGLVDYLVDRRPDQLHAPGL